MVPVRGWIAAALALVVTSAAGAPAAYAASTPTTLPADQFTLSADYHRYDGLVGALATRAGTAAVRDVMAAANHDRSAITDPLGLTGYTGGFTFDADDGKDCASYPQGITTSRDAVGTDHNGRYDGHQLVLVSWYTK